MVRTFTVTNVESPEKGVVIIVTDERHRNYALYFGEGIKVGDIRTEIRSRIKELILKHRKLEFEDLIGEVYEFD